MGLLDTVRAAAVTAFQAAGDIAHPATYKQVNGVTRDLVAGTVVPNTTDYALPRTIFSRFKEAETDQNVNVTTDEKFMFPALDLPITPSTGDIIVDADGRIWELIRRLSDPAAAVVIFQTRTSRSAP